MDAIDENDARFAMDSSAYAIQTLPNSSRNSIPTALVLPSPHERPECEPAARTHRYQPYPKRQDCSSSTTRDDAGPLEFQLPENVPEWSAALAQCHTLRLLPTPAPGRLYLFPPTHIFLVNDRMKRVRMIMNWLHVRPAWLARVQGMDSDEASISVQGWRDYLTHSPERGPLNRPTTTFTGRKAQKKAKSANTLLIFHELLPDGVPPLAHFRDYAWFGHTLDHDEPEEQLVSQRLVLWELDELAFRYDFVRLNRHFSKDLTISPEQQLVREAMVFHIWSAFPTRDKMFLDSKPPGDCGLGSLIWRYSIPALEAARQILCQWPNAPRELGSPLVHPPEANNLLVVRHMQQKVAQFYCQTYCKAFQTAPILPSQLPLPFISI
ncbi:hypothetical protein SISSUDRAFT_1067697 [Sistotremastrum suecicum HHB10207 ss-3]|uniref:Uncharacterized protein n=1 Tax=Sistotremastrum suecicum HHB10207 ss-3 TaxID=1314776 RepID=A0A165WTN2_9AGAM|nr:hypothetical protein SISSUDRAFT_1067697 [Sistotremastrum suecicum HHB10207 ss-3]